MINGPFDWLPWRNISHPLKKSNKKLSALHFSYQSRAVKNKDCGIKKNQQLKD